MVLKLASLQVPCLLLLSPTLAMLKWANQVNRHHHPCACFQSNPWSNLYVFHRQSLWNPLKKLQYRWVFSPTILTSTLVWTRCSAMVAHLWVHRSHRNRRNHNLRNLLLFSVLNWQLPSSDMFRMFRCRDISGYLSLCSNISNFCNLVFLVETLVCV